MVEPCPSQHSEVIRNLLKNPVPSNLFSDWNIGYVGKHRNIQQQGTDEGEQGSGKDKQDEGVVESDAHSCQVQIAQSISEHVHFKAGFEGTKTVCIDVYMRGKPKRKGVVKSSPKITGSSWTVEGGGGEGSKVKGRC